MTPTQLHQAVTSRYGSCPTPVDNWCASLTGRTTTELGDAWQTWIQTSTIAPSAAEIHDTIRRNHATRTRAAEHERIQPMIAAIRERLAQKRNAA